MPTSFEDMVLVAERADQAFMATHRRGGDHKLGQPRGNGGQARGGHKGGHSGHRGHHGGHRQGGSWSGKGAQGGARHGGQGGVRWDQVSQYNNHGYRGPAPMVLGAAQGVVCYQCG